MPEKAKAARLIAHRGYPLRYPENTLPGLQTSIEAGAKYLEFDIQLTRDRIPVLYHDASMRRTSGIDRLIMDLSAEELEFIDAGEPDRFGRQFKSTRIPSLALVVEMLSNHPAVQAFVEIKWESLAYFGVATVVDAVMACIRDYPRQFIVISFDYDCLQYARRSGSNPIGWAIETTDNNTLKMLASLRPEYLFTSVAKYSALRKALPGSWQWALYHATGPEQENAMLAAGADLVETDAIVEMLG